MANPQRPPTSAERQARAISRTFPGSGGGFVSGVSPVRPRTPSVKTNSFAGTSEAGPAISYIQPDTPAAMVPRELWFDTDDIYDLPEGGSVAETRTLIAGTGLTGGGDLTADRTFAIDLTAEAERVRDSIGTALIAGTGITVTVNDAGDTITVANTVTAYTDEQVRDVIGVALTAGTGITLTVNDAGDTITVTVDAVSEAERVRDVIGAALVAGTNITLTVNDAGDTITIDSTGGGGGSGGHTIMDETVALTARTYLDFQGAGVAVSDDAANNKSIVTIPGGGGGAVSAQTITFSQAGIISVTTDADTGRWYNRTGSSLTIDWVSASVGAQPTGSTITVDVNVSANTIFTTQANRPTIAAATNTSTKVTNHNVTTLPNNGYLTVNVDTVGSSFAGGNLVVEVGLS